MHYEFADERYPLSPIKYTAAILHYTQIVKTWRIFYYIVFWSLCVKTYLLFCTRYNKVTTRRKSVELDFYQFRQLLTPIYSTVKASVMVWSGIITAYR